MTSLLRSANTGAIAAFLTGSILTAIILAAGATVAPLTV